MPHYVCLVTFTDTGAKRLKMTTKRSAAFRDRMQKEGINFKATLWTVGQYDLVHIFEAKDDDAAAAFGYTLSALGNVRTNIMRGFTADEMDEVIANVLSPYSALTDLM